MGRKESNQTNKTKSLLGWIGFEMWILKDGIIFVLVEGINNSLIDSRELRRTIRIMLAVCFMSILFILKHRVIASV